MAAAGAGVRLSPDFVCKQVLNWAGHWLEMSWALGHRGKRGERELGHGERRERFGLGGNCVHKARIGFSFSFLFHLLFLAF